MLNCVSGTVNKTQKPDSTSRGVRPFVVPLRPRNNGRRRGFLPQPGDGKGAGDMGAISSGVVVMKPPVARQTAVKAEPVSEVADRERMEVVYRSNLWVFRFLDVLLSLCFKWGV